MHTPSFPYLAKIPFVLLAAVFVVIMLIPRYASCSKSNSGNSAGISDTLDTEFRAVPDSLGKSSASRRSEAGAAVGSGVAAVLSTVGFVLLSHLWLLLGGLMSAFGLGVGIAS